MKTYTTNELSPIEIKSVNKFSGEISGNDNYNEHIGDPWNAIWVYVYETRNNYHFLVGGWDYEKDGMPRRPFKAYSAKKDVVSYNYKSVCNFLVENPNWLDWED